MNRMLVSVIGIGVLLIGLILFYHHRVKVERNVGRGEGKAEIQALWNEAEQRARSETKRIETTWDTKLKEAEKNGKARREELEKDVVVASATSDRLRKLLASERNKLSTASLPSLREYSATLSDVFEECKGELGTLGKAADGHAFDALMLLEAWPKR